MFDGVVYDRLVKAKITGFGAVSPVGNVKLDEVKERYKTQEIEHSARYGAYFDESISITHRESCLEGKDESSTVTDHFTPIRAEISTEPIPRRRNILLRSNEEYVRER